MVGSSGTPLAQRLGIEKGHRVGLINAPDGFVELLEPLPEGAVILPAARSRRDVVVAFLRDRRELESKLAALHRAIEPHGAIWIAWPTQTPESPSALTDDVVRHLALPRGLVDDESCSIGEDWAGLRLVVRGGNPR